jgi:hypothetical protein
MYVSFEVRTSSTYEKVNLSPQQDVNIYKYVSCEVGTSPTYNKVKLPRNTPWMPVCIVSPVKYELGFYIPEDVILHSHRREHLKSYIALTGCCL